MASESPGYEDAIESAKRKLRRDVLQRRNAISERDRRERSEALCQEAYTLISAEANRKERFVTL